MIVHLIDGTYELFRHFYGARRINEGEDKPFGAVLGVLNTVLQLVETGGTHVGVATDHVIESFRNDLWPGYKTGEGIEPALWSQFRPLEEGLAAMGVAVWPMVELEADDGLASAAHLAAADARVKQVWIWTPDKDLAQCVVADRVIQVERERGPNRQMGVKMRNADGVVAKFGVASPLIPDYLALVCDSADGYPGIDGIGAKGAAKLIAKYGAIEQFPPEALTSENREAALLFKRLAILRTDAPLFRDVDELRWRGPTAAFEAWASQTGDRRIVERAKQAQMAAPA